MRDLPRSPDPTPRAEAPPCFARTLARHYAYPLRREQVATVQVNLGKRCNMACQHCHVEAGPKRTEMMTEQVAARVVELLARSPMVSVVDLTGGAPELNPHFRWLVTEARRLGKAVIDRCNLTVLLEPGMEDLARFLASQEVRIVASLPCYQPDNVEKQRGPGAFEKSMDALRQLNALGYGLPGSPLQLDLVYNPTGAALPPPQAALEARYKEELWNRFAVRFHKLLTLTNMPVGRFAHALQRAGRYTHYLNVLAEHFNPATMWAVMCRTLVNVSWDGRLYDCDFNQMLERPLAHPTRAPRTIWDIDSFSELAGLSIATGEHCFGCTAGAGSSCSGALA